MEKKFLDAAGVSELWKKTKAADKVIDDKVVIITQSVENLIDEVENLNAESIETNQTITVTTPVGNLEKGQVINVNTDLQSLLISMLSKDSNPIVTKPSITRINLIGAESKEVGSVFNPSYSIEVDCGRYNANGITTESGVTFNTWVATENGRPDSKEEQTKDSQTGSFEAFTVTPETNYYISGQVNHTDGIIPTSYLGKECPEDQIKAATLNVQNSSSVTGYRAEFWGYKNQNSKLNIENLTSAQIRNLGNSSKNNRPSQITTTNMQQIFFAFPAGRVNNISITNSTNAAPQTVLKKENGVNVEGVNGYAAIAYDIFYVDNAAPESGTTTFNVKYS